MTQLFARSLRANTRDIGAGELCLQRSRLHAPRTLSVSAYGDWTFMH